MTTTQDKLSPIATWNGGPTAAGVVSAGGGTSPRVNNIIGSLHLPFKIPAVSPEHDAWVLYGRTSPVGDYAAAPIGSLFLQYTITSTAISGLEIWKKETSTLWVTIGGGSILADPGDAAAISVAASGLVPIVTTGAETRTLAIPNYVGQELTLTMKTDGGDCVTTVASPIDAIGHTTITHNDAGDTITLKGVEIGAVLAWRVVHENGVLLGSTAGFGNIIADVGTGNAIPVTHKDVGMPITTAAAETNTLADPTMSGQTMSLWCDTYAVGDRVITAASAINADNNTIMTFGVVSDAIELKSVTVGGAYVWQVVGNDGVALT